MKKLCMETHRIIIFDGVCNFCNNSVNFIIARDPNSKFRFTPMQSDLAQELISSYGLSSVGYDTFLLIKNDKCYVRTDAAIEIAKELSGGWFMCVGFKVFPRFIRDWIYRLFARNRYALFGKRAYCMVPTADLKQRFVGIEQG